MSKFTAAGLVVFYQKVADGGTMFHDKYHIGKTKHETSESPSMASLASEWSVLPKKPAKKIIDLQPLIASGIDCEFSGHDISVWLPLGPLDRKFGDMYCPRWADESMGYYHKCRPRMNHKMFYNGEKPIEGFVVRVYFDNTSAILTGYRGDAYWANVTAIEYLEVEDGYAYPWEQAECDEGVHQQQN